MLFKWLATAPQYCFPQHALSRLLGAVANSRRPKLKNFLIKHFCRLYQVNLQEALLSNVEDYPHFNAFFTRALKPEARPLAADPNSLISPADGCISQIGDISNARLIQAKGHDFNLLELLGGQATHFESFKDGKFTTIYLSPKDYHRVHMPLSGKLTAMTHIPGKLFSVNKRTSTTVKNLFARNERVVCYFDTELGPMAVILVGAFFVASIETVWAGIVSPPTSDRVRHFEYTESQQQHFNRGDEIGRFQFGSTVIMLLPKGVMEWNKTQSADCTLKMGEALGQIIKPE